MLIVAVAAAGACNPAGDGDPGDGGDRPAADADGGLCPCGLVECSGYCVDPDTSVRHCGGCRRVCRADEACVEGECRLLCRELEASTHEWLVARLLLVGSAPTPEATQYVTVTEEIEILSADLGAGYIFVSDLAGIALDREVVYGFDPSLPDTFCLPAGMTGGHPVSPSLGYERMAIAPGTSFVAGLRTFVPYDPYGACPDGLSCEFWEAGGHFSYCCCTGAPFEWRVLTLREIPAICREPVPACETDLAGSDHSRCYDAYADYLAAGWPGVHERCVDPASGTTRFGGRCSCTSICDGDVSETVEGICNECGRCSVAMCAGASLTEPDRRCDFP